MRAKIEIVDEPNKGVFMSVGGSYVPGDGSLVEELANAAIAAIDAKLKEKSDVLGPPMVTGDKTAIERSVYADRPESVISTIDGPLPKDIMEKALEAAAPKSQPKPEPGDIIKVKGV